MFAEAAMRCWSVAVALLGWRPVEFWQATPAELLASLRKHGGEADTVDTSLLDDLRLRFPD